MTRLTSALRFRNPPPRPPNDPSWMVLDGQDGWPTAAASSGVSVSPTDCALTLQSLPGGALALADPSGRFGGLVPPPNVTLSPDGTVWLLDPAKGRLRRFDDCACVFVDIPATGGIGPGPRQLIKPAALAARGDDLLLLDAGQPGGPLGRVLVFARHGFALRAILAPPPGATAGAWTPVALASAPDGRVYVADPANGAVHVFERSGLWRRALTGLGAVSAIAVDRFGRLYVLVAGQAQVSVFDPDGTAVAEVSDVGVVRGCFAPLPDFTSDASGRINLAGRCAGAGWFDPSGQPSTAAVVPAPAFPASGTWLSEALDSRIGQCVWHRLIVEAGVPAADGLVFQSYTAEAALPMSVIAGLAPTAWTNVPLSGAGEALIQGRPGRYLWLRGVFSGDQQTTPRLRRLRIEYPRITLRRYLPEAFAPDPVSADFTDRLLAVFDQGFRSVERTIDNQADLFDPRSAPAVSPVSGAPDMLSWLASWVGVSFDRSWPVARRRRFLMQAARLYPCRGTLPGLRKVLSLFLGLDEVKVPRHPAPCGPGCAPAPPAWTPPPMILEHWKVRRWLWLGAGRLSDASVLWGETIMGRSQLGATAQLGATRLDTTREPVADPFNAEAYAFTVFVPGGLARTAQAQAAVRRMLADQTPAWTKATVRFVRPRMRIGIQASIGFDSVVGCWPEGVLLDQARLGKASVLGPATNIDPGARVGRSRIGPGARVA